MLLLTRTLSQAGRLVIVPEEDERGDQWADIIQECWPTLATSGFAVELSGSSELYEVKVNIERVHIEVCRDERETTDDERETTVAEEEWSGTPTSFSSSSSSADFSPPFFSHF